MPEYTRFIVLKDDVERKPNTPQPYKVQDKATGEDLIVGLTQTAALIIAKTLNSVDGDSSWTCFVQKG